MQPKMSANDPKRTSAVLLRKLLRFPGDKWSEARRRHAMPKRFLVAAAALFAAATAQATDSLDEAKQRLIESRAVEAVIWGMRRQL